MKQIWRIADGVLGGYGYDEEPEIKVAALKVRKNTMTSFERLATLWQQVRYLDRYNIEGSLIECGVWKGGSIGMMAQAHLHSHAKPLREIHLFDSFEGVPEPIAEKDGEQTVEWAGGRDQGALKSIGVCVGTREECRALVEEQLGYPSRLTHYHEGWFQNTLPIEASKLGPIALLRLDGDLYESTAVCLKHLYSKVVKGGVVVIDDYGHFEGCRKAVNEHIASLSERILLCHIDYSGRYWVRT